MCIKDITKMFDTQHLMRIAVLLVLFCVLGYYFYNYTPGYLIWPILVASAFAWFAFEYFQNKNAALVKNAFLLGLFLMVFDFIVENLGAYYNLWAVTVTVQHVLAVPIEVMLVCLIGGTAWALAQPKKFNMNNAIIDTLLFAIFGTIGEFTLIRNNIMFYAEWWTSICAFIGYFITWAILHWVWQGYFSKIKN